MPPPGPNDEYSAAANPFAKTPSRWSGSNGWHLGMPVPDKRPRSVGQACFLAGAVSAVVLLGTLVLLVAIFADLDAAKEYVEEELMAGRGIAGASPEGILQGIVVFVLIVLAWSASAIMLSVYTARGRSWARSLLAMSAVAVAILGIFSYEFLPALALAASALLTTALLYTTPAAEWFAYTSGDHPAAQLNAESEGVGETESDS